MEQNKLEKQFKEQLNSREIKPSEMAWDRLDAMLADAEKKKTKSNYNWIYIAASFVGLALFSTIYFSGFGLEKTNTPVVQEQKKTTKPIEEPERIDEAILSSQIQKKTIIVADNTNLNKQSKKLKDKEEVSIINQSKENNALIVSSENKDNQSKSKNKFISAEKLLAEVSNSKFEPKVIDETIKNSSKSISVNPNDLLLNAETELNQSYRESALERLNEKLKVVKTVLVNRNYKE